MISFFKKKQKQADLVQIAAPAINNGYPSIVNDIHNEFFTAGDEILKEAVCLLKELEQKDMAKGKRLAALGFSGTREAVVAIETENKLAKTKEISELVLYYKQNYPNNKFITEEQVKAICEKYGLVCGEISMYKGFVPEVKLQSIENFKPKEKDVTMIFCSKNIGWSGGTIGEIQYDGGRDAAVYSNIFKKVEIPEKLKICAPLKDMEIPSTHSLSGYKIKIKEVPDPVVLQPVNGGYLIVCAWGDEASDEIVVNEKMN
jgi:hypothetical protein